MGIVHEKESYAIMGACFEVYREKGCGFLEPVYQECLALELGQREFPHVGQPGLQLDYKGNPLDHRYKPDFVCFEKIILEIDSYYLHLQ